MRSVNNIADEIIAREGGYVNDPSDPGGATKYGVTINTLRRLRLDLNNDGQVAISDVKQLSKSQVRKIYVSQYYHAPKIDQLPLSVQATVFDMYVNSGAQAVRILQKLLLKMGISVAVDGAIGPETVAAVKQAIKIAPRHFVDAYGIERRNFYYRLADHRPASRKYAQRRNGKKGGWIKRAEAFVAPKYHLSNEEHHERVKQWG